MGVEGLQAILMACTSGWQDSPDFNTEMTESEYITVLVLELECWSEYIEGNF